MTNTFRILILVFATALSISCTNQQPESVADVIYFGGDIITLNDSQPTAEAVAIKDGKILSVGVRKDIEKQYSGDTTKVVNLLGKSLLPGFLDAHSHYYSSLSVANQVKLYPSPAGPGQDVKSIIAELINYRDENNIPKGDLIQAYGYDDTVMPAGRLINRDDLDKALPDNPVIVTHISMHGAVLNSLAMKKWNISAETKTPPGGVIVRKPGTNEPYGLIMETAYLPIFESLPTPSLQQQIDWSRAGQMLYAEAGITTAHEGATHITDLAVMKHAADAGANIIDIIAYPFITDLDSILKDSPIETWGRYNNRLKIGGVKITGDGSPQGKTAFFSTPYLTGGPDGEENWLGEPTFSEEQLTQMVKKVYDLGVPLNYHANGDAAIDLLLRAHESAAAGDLEKDRDVTIIHAQFTRKEHIDQFVKYKMTPSLYTLHTYYFAEAHMKNRGKQQTEYINPMRDIIDAGLNPTNHTDFLVSPLDQMFMLWSAVNRVSRNGEVIGADQRVTPLEGLKAMTINVARQYGEQDFKGSIEVGKLADLVILDKNPLKIEPMFIKDIKIIETIKEGNTIFQTP